MTAKRWRPLVTALAVALAATLIAAGAVRGLSFLAGLETVARDVRVAALSPPQPTSDRIAIAAIDESTVAQFPYRSPIDRAFLAELIETLQAKGARAIGVDILFDQPTEPTKDARLRAVLDEARVPLVVSYTISRNVVTDEQRAYLDAFVPARLRGEANLLTDPFDGAVRWINPGAATPGAPRGFVPRIAQAAGIARVPGEPVEIAWRRPPDGASPAFPTFPAQAVPVLPDAWIAGKIVLIGAVQSITDRHRTPLAIIDDGARGMMPGVEVQAHGIQQLLDHRSSGRPGPLLFVATVALVALLGATTGMLRSGPAAKVALGIVLLAAYWATAMLGFEYGLPAVPVVAPTLAFALAVWLMDVVGGRAERRQRQFIQGAFSRYVSPAVVDSLVADPSALNITGTRRELTFIFTDIAGFTTLSEGLESDRLSDTLNAYLDGACAIILRHEGTIDKFIGDAIMAIFNAPIAQADHASRAVRCAIELDAYAERFRAERNAAGIPIGVTRIGVHTGSATVGNFGSSARMDFTALGDAVNTAARTEGVNKYFGTRLCVTGATADACPDLSFRRIGDVVLKGKANAVALFAPLTDDSGPALAAGYAVALASLDAGDAPAARAAFADLVTAWPGDPLSAYHLKRIEAGVISTRIVLDDK